MTDTQKQPGICYVCGCTEDNNCNLGLDRPFGCHWTDETQTLCNNPTCLAADATERGEGRPIGLMSRTHLVIEQARKAIIDNHGGQGTDAELVGYLAAEIAELREQGRALIKEVARLNCELDEYRGG